jgi:predicted nucleic-acid-binding Zn-ribbon protein
MTDITACSKCKSEKIVPTARVMDRGHYSGDAGNLTLVIYEKPDALIFKGSHKGALSARVCGECGYTELFLDNPRELYEIYQNAKNKES